MWAWIWFLEAYCRKQLFFPNSAFLISDIFMFPFAFVLAFRSLESLVKVILNSPNKKATSFSNSHDWLMMREHLNSLSLYFIFPSGGNNSKGLTLSQLVKVELACWVLWHSFSPQLVQGIKKKIPNGLWRVNYLKNACGLHPKLCFLVFWFKHRGQRGCCLQNLLKDIKLHQMICHFTDLSLYHQFPKGRPAS